MWLVEDSTSGLLHLALARTQNRRKDAVRVCMRRFDARDDLDDTVNRRLLPCNDQSIKVGWLYPLDVSDSFEAADRRSAKVEVGW